VAYIIIVVASSKVESHENLTLLKTYFVFCTVFIGSKDDADHSSKQNINVMCSDFVFCNMLEMSESASVFRIFTFWRLYDLYLNIAISTNTGHCDICYL